MGSGFRHQRMGESMNLGDFRRAMNNGSIGRHHCEWAISEIMEYYATLEGDE